LLVGGAEGTAAVGLAQAGQGLVAVAQLVGQRDDVADDGPHQGQGGVGLGGREILLRSGAGGGHGAPLSPPGSGVMPWRPVRPWAAAPGRAVWSIPAPFAT